MGYLYDEYTRHRQGKVINTIDDFTQLTFEIVRAMQKACEIAVKLGYVSAIKVPGKPKLNTNPQALPTSSNKPVGDVGKGIKRGADAVKEQKRTCYMCGRYEHNGSSGRLLNMHPDVNTDPTLTWADFAEGKHGLTRDINLFQLLLLKGVQND